MASGGTTVAPVAATKAPVPPGVGRLIRNGDALLVGGNIAAARSYYQLAAAANSGAAATRLGKTYDPGFLSGIGAENADADASSAAAWYRRAIALGDREARARLARLGVGAAE